MPEQDLIAEAMPESARRRIDAAMLSSLSAWFYMRPAGHCPYPHPFDDWDVAEMLSRASRIVDPLPRDMET